MMYHTAVPIRLQWPYTIPTTNVHNAIARSNSPVFITGCNDIISVLPVERFGTPTLCAIPTNRILATVGLSNLRFPEQQQKFLRESSKTTSPLPRYNSEETKHVTTTAPKIEAKEQETAIEKPYIEYTPMSSSARGQKRQLEDNAISSVSNDCLVKSKKHKNEGEEEETIKSDKADNTASKRNNDSEKLILEVLSQRMWSFYKQHQQTEEMFERKMRLRDALFNILREIYPCSGLYIVGSSLTQLGLNNSDLDLCLMLTHKEIDQEIEATSILALIYEKILHLNFITRPQVIQAKVPILKFVDRISGVEVDLNVNNAVGIRNTQLIHCYSRLDWRFAPLSVMIKLWARQHNINEARSQTLSSYSLILMLVHFLQFACDPPVLPCLQKMLNDKFSPFADVRKLTLREDLPAFTSSNKMNLGELLLEFLNYFGNKFDFSKDVISVRTGGTLPKQFAMNCRSPKNKRGQWKFIGIEEPMDRTNTARSVFNERAFARIIQVFQISYKMLLHSKDLNSIIDINTSLS